MHRYCFFQSEIVETNRAFLQLNDLGVLRGYGIFDYLRTYNLKLFLLNDYLARFQNSSSFLRLNPGYTNEKLENIIYELLDVNKIETDVGIRLVCTGGPTEDSVTMSKPVFYILIEDLQVNRMEIQEGGVKLKTLEYQRLFPHIKTTSYINTVFYNPDMKKNNVYDLLFYSNKIITETSRSNFYLVKSGKVITNSENILEGITRKLVLSLTENVEMRPVYLDEIKTADECFVTGSTKGIVPVVQIDDLVIGDGKPGVMTLELSEKFEKFVKDLF